jgi:hypothetical protein
MSRKVIKNEGQKISFLTKIKHRQNSVRAEEQNRMSEYETHPHYHPLFKSNDKIKIMT